MDPMIAEDDFLKTLEEEESMDDIGEIKAKYMPKILPPENDEFNSSQVPVDTISKREVQEMIESIPKPMFQKPIQPGASPQEDNNRFLCWNNTGIIRAQHSNDDQSIDVMFHDTEKHSSVNFKNDPNYCFGSLSDSAIALGSNGHYGTGPATVYGIDLLEGNRDQREWEVELPHVELVEALAVGRGFVAVATDQRTLRLFTNSGMQSYVFSLPGQILCMVAHDHKLMLIHHNGAGHAEEMNLSMSVYYIDILGDLFRQLLPATPVALSKRSPLAWAGFSDEGTPCTCDFNGILRVYRHELAKNWVPLLNLRDLTSSALDHYFVVGVSELSQAVRAVRCKRSRYPDFNAETVEVFSFSMPMCNMDTDKGRLEEEHVRLRVANISYQKLSHVESVALVAQASSESNEKLIVNTLLRLFALYLKEDKEELARSLVLLMPRDHMSKLPEFAWKTNRRQNFIESLNRAIEEREQLELEGTVEGPQAVDDDVASVSSVTSHHRFGRDLRKELEKKQSSATNANASDDAKLRPIPLDKLTTNTRSLTDKSNTVDSPDYNDEDSTDENDLKIVKRAKTINYNLFSKKQKTVNNN